MRPVRLLFSAIVAYAAVSSLAAGAANASQPTTADAQALINREIVPRLHAYDESLTISVAKCPDRLPSRDGEFTCTLVVNGATLRIPLSYERARINLPALSFYESKRLEASAEAELASSFGVNATVTCADVPLLLLRPGTLFSCAVHGASNVTQIRFKALPNGELFTFNPPGLSTPAWITTAIKTHGSGKRTLVNGSLVAAMIKSAAHLFHVSHNPEQPEEQWTEVCPAVLDLTGKKDAICTATLPDGQVQRQSVSILPVVGIDAKPLDAVVDMQKIQRLAQDDLNNRLAAHGLARDAAVQCDGHLRVIQSPPAMIYCKASAGGGAYVLNVNVQDASATVNWRAVPASPSPSPTASPESGSL